MAVTHCREDRTQWWVGDSGASVHGTSSARHMYSLRTPATDESRLIVGSSEEMTVELIGDLDVVLHCDEDVVVTLKDVAYIPGLRYEPMSFNIIQESEQTILDKTGAHMLGGRVCFSKDKNGNSI